MNVQKNDVSMPSSSINTSAESNDSVFRDEKQSQADRKIQREKRVHGKAYRTQKHKNQKTAKKEPLNLVRFLI